MKTIKDVDVKDKRVIIREDFNVPLEGRDIVDNSKLKAALPTIKYLREHDAKIILMSDLGAPQGHSVPELRIDSVAAGLEQLLDCHIKDVGDHISDITFESIATLVPGEILMLENLGFSRGEYNNNDEFAQGLASLADIYVDDAFSIADKVYASNVGITKYIPCYAGLLLEKELEKADSSIRNYPAIKALGDGHKIEEIHHIEFDF